MDNVDNFFLLPGFSTFLPLISVDNSVEDVDETLFRCVYPISGFSVYLSCIFMDEALKTDPIQQEKPTEVGFS